MPDTLRSNIGVACHIKIDRHREDHRINPNHESPGLHRYRFANAEFDEARSSLWVNGEPVTVEPLPLQLLTVLLQRPDEVVTRAELFGAIWQDRPTVDHVLANAISKLRRALGEEAGAHLVNVPRIGYRLTGPVERIAVGRRQAHPLNLAAGQPVPGQEDFMLVRALGDGVASTTWLTERRQLAQHWVFKFACDGEQLAALKREFTVCRLLQKELGPRSDLVDLRGNNFSTPPFFLAYEDAGIDLGAWAAEDRLATLTVEQRLALFLKIAHAVAAAHSVGVLHRDLKPSNVLIRETHDPTQPDAHWQVRLSDFGSSRLLTPDRLTALGVTAMGMTVVDGSHPLLGSTPQYLAPELLAGESASMRSDLFALGLILYQFLAGDLSRPLATGWEHDIADPLLVDDVRAATEGRPERRLASVAQLIDRLESLDQRRAQGVAAAEAAQRAQTTAHKLETLRAQRPWMVALCVCLLLGGLGAVWFGVQARATQRQAEQATARTRAMNDFLNADVLQASGVAGAVARNRSALIELISRASDRAGERFKDDPPVLAQVRRQLGDIYLGMSFNDQAEYEYRRAITISEPWVPADDAELLTARFALAQALTGRGRPQPALAAFATAARLAGPHVLSSSGALARRAMQSHVQVLVDAQRYQQAMPLAQELLRMTELPTEEGIIDNPRRIQARQLLEEICLGLGDTTRATALQNELAAPPFNARTAGVAVLVRARLRLASEQLRQKRTADAERLLAGLRETVQKDAASDGVLLGLVERGWYEVYRTTSRQDDAYRASAAALQALGAALGDRHSLVTNARMNVALAELDQGRFAEALRDLESARARINADGNHGDELTDIDLGRARALTALGRQEQASRLLEDLHRTSPDDLHASVAWSAR